MSWLQKISNNGIPSILAGLAAEAKKYSSPEEFEKAYLHEIKHGMYWHITDDPNFFIDPNKGPSDMSSMANGTMSPGKLMVTSHLEYWATNYAPQRRYAALIDMSFVDSKQYYQVNRGFGNEFFVEDPTNARVVGVFPIKEALRIDYEHDCSVPKNAEELYNLWHRAQQSQVIYPSQEELLSHYQHADASTWDQKWKEEWASEWEQ